MLEYTYMDAQVYGVTPDNIQYTDLYKASLHTMYMYVSAWYRQ